MSKRLIFFSGGVESTAMLNLANPNDIILTVDMPYKPGISYNKDNVENIAGMLGFEITKAKISLDYPIKNFAHQINLLMPLANFLCLGDEEINEVWFGRSNQDGRHPQAETYLKAWKLLQPNVPWNYPLINFSKKEIWNMIPEDIQPFVSSCVFQHNCGHCPKCQEFKERIILEC
jgi:7-cyano-7-deazaguanine synthase in queuosine biosynthesis